MNLPVSHIPISFDTQFPSNQEAGNNSLQNPPLQYGQCQRNSSGASEMQFASTFTNSSKTFPSSTDFEYSTNWQIESNNNINSQNWNGNQGLQQTNHTGMLPTEMVMPLDNSNSLASRLQTYSLSSQPSEVTHFNNNYTNASETNFASELGQGGPLTSTMNEFNLIPPSQPMQRPQPMQQSQPMQPSQPYARHLSSDATTIVDFSDKDINDWVPNSSDYSLPSQSGGSDTTYPFQNMHSYNGRIVPHNQNYSIGGFGPTGDTEYAIPAPNFSQTHSSQARSYSTQEPVVHELKFSKSNSFNEFSERNGGDTGPVLGPVKRSSTESGSESSTRTSPRLVNRKSISTRRHDPARGNRRRRAGPRSRRLTASDWISNIKSSVKQLKKKDDLADHHENEEDDTEDDDDDDDDDDSSDGSDEEANRRKRRDEKARKRLLEDATEMESLDIDEIKDLSLFRKHQAREPNIQEENGFSFISETETESGAGIEASSKNNFVAVESLGISQILTKPVSEVLEVLPTLPGNPVTKRASYVIGYIEESQTPVLVFKQDDDCKCVSRKISKLRTCNTIRCLQNNKLEDQYLKSAQQMFNSPAIYKYKYKKRERTITHENSSVQGIFVDDELPEKRCSGEPLICFLKINTENPNWFKIARMSHSEPYISYANIWPPLVTTSYDNSSLEIQIVSDLIKAVTTGNEGASLHSGTFIRVISIIAAKKKPVMNLMQLVLILTRLVVSSYENKEFIVFAVAQIHHLVSIALSQSPVHFDYPVHRHHFGDSRAYEVYLKAAWKAHLLPIQTVSERRPPIMESYMKGVQTILDNTPFSGPRKSNAYYSSFKTPLLQDLHKHLVTHNMAIQIFIDLAKFGSSHIQHQKQMGQTLLNHLDAYLRTEGMTMKNVQLHTVIHKFYPFLIPRLSCFELAAPCVDYVYKALDTLIDQDFFKDTKAINAFVPLGFLKECITMLGYMVATTNHRKVKVERVKKALDFAITENFIHGLLRYILVAPKIDCGPEYTAIYDLVWRLLRVMKFTFPFQHDTFLDIALDQRLHIHVRGNAAIQVAMMHVTSTESTLDYVQATAVIRTLTDFSLASSNAEQKERIFKTILLCLST